MTGRFRAISASRSETGNVRKLNEDACLDLPEKGLWVVADGMGGHAAGDVASRMIVDSLRRIDRQASPGELIEEVEDTLLAVNGRLAAKAGESEEALVIGSTVALLLAFHAHCVLAWAGDSRVYRVRSGTFEQLTRDHSEVQDLITQGHLQPEQAEQHANANVITRAVGGTTDLYLDFDLRNLANGDRYLLCSDGLYKELSEGELATHLQTGDVAQACDALLTEALSREGIDNITVIVIEFSRDDEPADVTHPKPLA